MFTVCQKNTYNTEPTWKINIGIKFIRTHTCSRGKTSKQNYLHCISTNRQTNTLAACFATPNAYVRQFEPFSLNIPFFDGDSNATIKFTLHLFSAFVNSITDKFCCCCCTFPVSIPRMCLCVWVFFYGRIYVLSQHFYPHNLSLIL